jgi:hypothetical protein
MLTAALLKLRRTAPLYHYTDDSLGKFSTRDFTEVNITPLKSESEGAASGSTDFHPYTLINSQYTLAMKLFDCWL